MRFATALVATFVMLPVCAQQRAPDDDAALLRDMDRWDVREVGDGVLLRQRRFERLFGSPQSLTVLTITPSAHVRFDLAAPERRTVTSAIGSTNGALAAINGGYFDIKNTGKSIGLLRLDGALVVPADPGQPSVGIDADGTLRLAKRRAGDWPDVFEALGAGPMLLVRGTRVVHGEKVRTVRHPRSALGVTADGTVHWLAVDGRTPPAAGTTFDETARVLEAFGCTDALNLDGGGSTALWVAGLGVCNHPCDNRQFDHAGERAVANALLLRAPAVVVVDDDDAQLDGADWQQRAAGPGVHGADYATSDAVGACATFRVALPFDGAWRVTTRRPPAERNAGPWLATIAGRDEPRAVAGDAARWCDLGRVELDAPGTVEITLRTPRGRLVVDALRVVQVPAPATAPARR